jgi:hypothetical protein
MKLKKLLVRYTNRSENTLFLKYTNNAKNRDKKEIDSS